MIDKQYNNKTIFAIKTKNNEVHYLQLSADNYQQQFVHYLRENKISKQQAYQLKQLIQVSIRQRAQQQRLAFKREEQRIKNQLIQWQNKPIISRQTSLESEVNKVNPTRIQTIRQGETKQQNSNKNISNLSYATPSQKQVVFNTIKPVQISKSQYGIQVEIQINKKQPNLKLFHPINTDIQIKSSSCQVQNQQVNQRIVKLPTFSSQEFKQHSLKYSLCSNQPNNIQISSILNSPRFKEIQSQNQQRDQFNFDNDSVTQQQTQPRKNPQKHSVDNFQSLFQSFHKSTQANSPDGSNKQLIPTPKQHKKKNKKIVLLQNYKRKNKQQKKAIINSQQSSSKQKSIPSSSLSAKKYPKIKYNPQTTKRLFQNQTASFKNKYLRQINTKQQQDYIQYLQYLQNVPRLIIHQLQDMSTKTTKSFRAKHEPQPNIKQIKQQQDYQRSFQQHLIMKRLQRERKQKLKKQKQGQNFQPKGSHCEQKIIRQQMQKLNKIQQQKQKQIRQRIKKQIRQNRHRNLAERSCSPASLSRGCPCCKPTPSKQKSRSKIQQIKKNIISKSNKTNIKYMSNVLLQAQQQFTSQLKN